MKKSSLYLSEEQVAKLRRISAAERRSQAEVIRAAIDAYPDVSAGRSFRAFAVGPGEGDAIAEIPEEELLEGFGDS